MLFRGLHEVEHEVEHEGAVAGEQFAAGGHGVGLTGRVPVSRGGGVKLTPRLSS